jgi:hypothetical protein
MPAGDPRHPASYPDDGVAVDWRRLAPDYDIICAVAFTVARAAGRNGPLTPEMALRWWIDLYRAERQEPCLNRAEQALLEDEKTDAGIVTAIPMGIEAPSRRLIGPTYGGVAAVTHLDRMIRRLLARTARSPDKDDDAVGEIKEKSQRSGKSCDANNTEIPPAPDGISLIRWRAIWAKYAEHYNTMITQHGRGPTTKEDETWRDGDMKVARHEMRALRRARNTIIKEDPSGC